MSHKMDASEQLVLADDVCHQLGILYYYPDVHTRTPRTRRLRERR